MDREILFKGFHECEGGKERAFYGCKWHKGIWVEGYFCRAFRWTGDKYPVPAIQEADSFSFREVAPETVCQYTGLDDKHEKKIFENDIVLDKEKGRTGRIEFSSACWLIRMNTRGSNFEFLSNRVQKFMLKCPIEIIGNKFENPEFLEVEK